MRPAKRQKVERREWEKTDAALWCPTALVGTPIRVFWPGEGRFFPGKIVRYSESSFEHDVLYDDGDQETLVLAVEKVQLPADCLGSLPGPSSRHLAALGRHLDNLADKLEAKALQQRTVRGRATLKEDDRQKLELLRRRAADFRSSTETRMAQQADANRGNTKASPSQRAAAAPLTPSKLGRAAAVSASAAAARSAHSRGIAERQQLAIQAQQVGVQRLADTGDQGTASARRPHPGSSKVPPVGMRPERPQRSSGRDAAVAPIRVCSPASARRRQSLPEQHGTKRQTQGTRHCGPIGLMGGLVDAAGGGTPPVVGSQDPVLSKLGGQAGADDMARGRVANGTTVDIGNLYVPLAWPAVRVLATSSSTADAGLAVAAGSAKAGSQGNQQPGGVEDVQEVTAPANCPPGMKAGGSASGRGCAADDEQRKEAAAADELREAYKQFRQNCSSCKQYHEIQVALWLSPEQIVGREIRVLWPDEGAWFCGRVGSYDAGSGMHTVEYDDGDVEHLHLAAEEVRLQVVPGESEKNLCPQSPEQLERLATHMAASGARLREHAGGLSRLKQKRKPGAAQAPAGSLNAEPEDPDELLAKAERWSARAAQLQALAGIMRRVAAGSDPRRRAGLLTPTDGQGPGRQAHGKVATAGGDAVPAVAAPASAPAAASGPPEEAAVTGRDADLTGEVAQAGGAGSQTDPNAGDGLDRSASSLPELAPGLPSDWASRQVLRPGEVVWAQVRRSTPWPAIIITREEAAREGLNVSIRRNASAVSSGQIAFVRFFGDHTVLGLPVVEPGARIPDRGGVLPLLAGIELGWHARRGGGGGVTGQAGRGQRFLRAMFELRTYMTEGELPRGMIPPNYDEEEDDSYLSPEEGLGGPSCRQQPLEQPVGAHSGKGKEANATPPNIGASSSCTLPLVLGPKMRVLQLGEVVWLSRWFHDEKYIYPVGFRAVRVMASGASGGREVRHTMEVVASEDGVRPVFRITPEGEPPICGDTATRAMRALFEDDARARGRAFARTGADLFGLSNPRVAALIRSLPGAERCERFANWPDQDRPPPPPLTPHEEVLRRAMYARALRLTTGAQSISQTKSGMCFECEVCGEDEESSDNLKLECDLCRCVVHSGCYGVTQPPHGAMWLCDVCQLHAAGLPRDRSPPCELCPVAGGPMKRTETGGFVHLLCAVWTPGVTFGDPESLEPVEGVAKAVHSRASLRCTLCKQPHGACIQCSARCYTAFHPMCAREAGIAMCEVRQGATARRPMRCRGHLAQSQPSAQLPPGTLAEAATAAGMEVDGGKENKSTLANAAVSAAAAVPTTGAQKDGEALDDRDGKEPSVGISALLSRASSGVAVMEQTQQAEKSSDAVALPAVATAATAVTEVLVRRRRGRPRSEAASRRAATTDLDACLGGLPSGSGISLVCFCPRHEELVLHMPHVRCSYPGGRFASRREEMVREQLRARREQLLQERQPDQPAQPQPPQQQQPRLTEDAVGVTAAAQRGAATGRAMSFADWRSRGHRAPEAMAIALEKRTFVRQLPYLVTGRLRQDEAAVRCLGAHCVRFDAAAASGRGTKVAGSNPDGAKSALTLSRQTDADLGPELEPGSDPGSGDGTVRPVGSLLPLPLVQAAMAAGARSVAERYAAMRATVGQRLAAGKSAIHGWGAFAKVPHKRGDMLIEYAGELIRPVVSDVREKRMYNKLVGCGTYIFNLNDDQHIDATRAGNMAHLLNHSCDPNCYSRTITLTDADTGTTTDHVIITAKRDIQAWEELTYDYRFNSTEELPCNCGAATCRLLVNWPERPAEEEGCVYESDSDDDGLAKDHGAEAI